MPGLGLAARVNRFKSGLSETFPGSNGYTASASPARWPTRNWLFLIRKFNKGFMF